MSYRIIKWSSISHVGVACGCDLNGGNKCVIVLGRFVREMANVPPFKSSTATIGEKCDMRAREV